jgi:hypothetical protein
VPPRPKRKRSDKSKTSEKEHKAINTLRTTLLIAGALTLHAAPPPPFTATDPLGINADDIAALNAMPEQALLRAGFVDVTKPPFSADPCGKKDSTKAIADAVSFGRHHKLAVWFPIGEYLASDTIECRGGWCDERTKEWLYLPFCELWPCVLIGERKGSQRPTIKLAPGSPGFDKPGKPVLTFVSNGWSRPAPFARPAPFSSSVGFNQLLYGIDVEIGVGNPGAVAVSCEQAEGSTIQDCEFRVGEGYAGLLNGPGGGGGVYNLTVKGGRFGSVNEGVGRPGVLFTGCRFEGQREAVMSYSCRGSLVCVGCEFKVGPGIPWLRGRNGAQPPNCLNAVDCIVDYASAMRDPLIEAETAVSLLNIWIRNASGTLAATQNGKVSLPGGAGWALVREAGFPYQMENSKLTTPVYVDLKPVEGNHLKAEVAQGEPPADLRSRHLLWDPARFPQWNDPEVINVCDTPFNARGDGKADDTEALQKAIDAHEKLFLPKGVYRITRPLRLRPNSKLIGVSQAYTLIAPMTAVGGAFEDPQHPEPVFLTADTAQAETQLAFIGVFMPREEVRAAYLVDWRCGGRSSMRCVIPFTGYTENDLYPMSKGLRPWINWKWEEVRELSGYKGGVRHWTHKNAGPYAMSDRDPNWPLARVRGHGAGAWYPFVALDGRWQGPKGWRVLVENIKGPFNIYMAHLQYGNGESQMAIVDSENIGLYQIKNEFGGQAVTIRGSRHIRAIGFGGWLFPGTPEGKFFVDRSSDITFGGFIWNFKPSASNGHPVVRVKQSDGVELITKPYEMPAFFSIGRSTPGSPKNPTTKESQ